MELVLGVSGIRNIYLRFLSKPPNNYSHGVTRRAFVVVNFRSDHTPMVLTGETREMQEKATPAKCPSNKQGKASDNSGVFLYAPKTRHNRLWRYYYLDIDGYQDQTNAHRTMNKPPTGGFIMRGTVVMTMINDEYPDFLTTTGYTKVDGLHGVNCL